MFASIARRWNLMVVSILLLIFLTVISACGSTATTSNPGATNAPTDTPTASVSDPLSSDAATQTFTQMATAIKNNDYTTLYNLTSAAYQANHTQQQMISDIQKFIYAPNSNGAAITDFGIGPVKIGTHASDNATVANGSMSFTFANGNVSGVNPSLVAENGTWKIADLFYNQS